MKTGEESLTVVATMCSGLRLPLLWLRREIESLAFSRCPFQNKHGRLKGAGDTELA
jgi:hypothetical protein